MIISGLAEEKILEELIFDRKIVANEAKKIAKTHITRFLKQRRAGIDEDFEYGYTIHTNKNKIHWICNITINMIRKPYWSHYAACMAESENGQKEYYHVRGFSNNSPYYVRVTSHALKRFKERGIEETLRIKPENVGGDFAALIFQHGEIITWMKVVDPKFWSIVNPFEDSKELTTLFRTLHGNYLGNITEKGNCEFMTFLGRKKELKKIGETEAMQMCRLTHLIFNERIYDKSMYDIEGDDKESLMMVEELKNKFPNKLLP